MVQQGGAAEKPADEDLDAILAELGGGAAPAAAAQAAPAAAPAPAADGVLEDGADAHVDELQRCSSGSQHHEGICDPINERSLVFGFTFTRCSSLCHHNHHHHAGATPAADAEPAGLTADDAAEAADDETAEEGGKVCTSISGCGFGNMRHGRPKLIG